ncbi:MAG: IS30 family transposase [bacterium]|nr:IS30 family transposase [bacterium]
MNTYNHINQYERDLISAGLEKGYSYRDIGKILRRHHMTISREVTRNKLYAPKPSLVQQPYIASKAQKKAEKRRTAQRTKAPLKNTVIFVYVREHLRNPYNWSPETIAGRVTIDHPGSFIDDETIYRYIYGKGKHFKLWKYLIHHRKKRMKKDGRKVQKYARLTHAVPIDNRPEEINNRVRLGDYESDNMEGVKSDKTAVSITVDRASRKVNIKKLRDLTALTKATVLIDQFKKDGAHTMTVDRGSENSRHDKVEQQTGIITYACNPYHSWEKGTVENTVGRVRRKIPKGTSVDPIRQKTLTTIEHWMNNTPRKCLGFLTPNEFHENMQSTS